MRLKSTRERWGLFPSGSIRVQLPPLMGRLHMLDLRACTPPLRYKNTRGDVVATGVASNYRRPTVRLRLALLRP